MARSTSEGSSDLTVAWLRATAGMLSEVQLETAKGLFLSLNSLLMMLFSRWERGNGNVEGSLTAWISKFASGLLEVWRIAMCTGERAIYLWIGTKAKLNPRLRKRKSRRNSESYKEALAGKCSWAISRVLLSNGCNAIRHTRKQKHRSFASHKHII